MATAKTYNGASYDATGITLSTSYNPVTITGDLVTGAINAVYGNNSYVWRVTNLGTVQSTNTGGNGIYLNDGGSVTNGSTTDQNALITGPFTGVGIVGMAGTVTNDGTISSPGSGGFGVYFINGGTVTNGAPTVQKALISGYAEGIGIKTGTAVVANDGTVTATGTGGSGVNLTDGGSITNGALTALSALISGYADGIKISGTAGTVTNLGTVSATGGTGVYLAAGGSVSNGTGKAPAALISGDADGIKIAGTTGRAVNLGTVSSTGGIGVDLAAGGSVVNGSDTMPKALISGYALGILISGAAGTVTNLGTATATGAGDGVYLASGGSVRNGSALALSALISGYNGGIRIASSPGTVTNFGTVTAAGDGNGVYLLDGGSVSNGATSVQSALVSGSSDGIKISGVAGTVTNDGTVTGQIRGVELDHGGSVTNGAPNALNALISGLSDGIIFVSYPGTVSNLGTVASTGSIGVYLASGGSVSNGAFTAQKALISGYADGIKISGTAGTVTNLGTVITTGYGGDGINLAAGGSVRNGAVTTPAALILGSDVGIEISGTAGTVTNFGTVAATGGTGVQLIDGGSVSNGTAKALAALIRGYFDGIVISGAAGTVTNLATVTAAANYGVYLTDGGSVSNGSATAPAALISGDGYGIAIAGMAGTVTNLGTVNSAAGVGVELRDGGSVRNGATDVQSALVSGYAGGIAIFGAAGTVTNDGTVTSHARGVELDNNGSVTNGAPNDLNALISGGLDGIALFTYPGRVTNLGTVLSANGYGILFQGGGGTVTNGAATARGALISGYSGGIAINGSAGTVTNFGTVMASAGAGVFLANGGSVSNGATNVGSALISGFSDGVLIAGGGSVTNLGTVTGYRGIQLGSGSVTNGAPTALNALISGVLDGVSVSGAGTVTNLGKVAATGNPGFGFYLTKGGSVTNGGPGVTTALISGYSIGVEIASAGGMVTNNGTIAATGTGGIGVQLKGVTVGTLINSGVIAGAHDAVFLSQAAADVLVVNPGAVFDGTVNGGGTGKAEFTQAGVVNFSNFDGFGTVVLASGAANTLSLTNANFTGVTGAAIVVTLGNNGNTIDASAETGGNRAAFEGGAGTDVLTGGSGNDFFSLSAATLAVSTVNGNGGNDVLAVSTAGALSLAGVSGIEMITLASGAANTLSLTNANFTGVTGAAITLTLGNNGNTIDASAETGGNRVAFEGGAGTDVLTGGSGNDFFSLSAATLAVSTVNGNGGNDVLAVSTAGALSLGGVSGIETITLKSGAANTLSLTNANFTGVTGAKITVAGGNNGDTLSESGVAATNLAVLLGGSGADTLIAGPHATLTGGLGADAFEFVTPGSIATPDSNTVTDFVHGTDKFTFSDIGFNLGLAGATSTPQALPSNLFSTKTDGTFDNTTERFAYNASTGQVIYSDDGSGSDPSLAVATLTGHPTLTTGDLYFVT